MDPVDRIASALAMDCARALRMFLDIKHILDSSENNALAARVIAQKGYSEYVCMENLELVPYEIGRFCRCVETMEDTKVLARKVFAVNFQDSDACYVFNQETSFSYACKMLSLVGPSLGHFSNSPTSQEIIHMELRLACQTPFLALQSYSDLLCLESTVPGLPGVCVDLGHNFVLEDLRKSSKNVNFISDSKRRKTSAGPTPKKVTPISKRPILIMSTVGLECAESMPSRELGDDAHGV